MLTNMKDILLKAQKGGYGVIAPSCDNEVCIEHAIKAAEAKRSPVILNLVWQGFRDQWERDVYIHFARKIAEHASVPVAINQDHGPTYQSAIECIAAGFGSIMVDRSKLPFEENIAEVAEIVKIAHACGVSVEAELGHVGMGDETRTNSMFGESIMTDPNEAKEYVERTQCDFLAVSIGNAHGVYAHGTPHIDFDRLAKIREVVDIPLVLHGGSGTGDENLSKACQMGICKVNVGTELRRGAEMAIRNHDGFMKFPFTVAYEGWQERVEYHMDLFGCTGKADE